MKVTVRSSELVKELGVLEKIVSKKPTLPVLANALLQTHGGWLFLSATNLEVSLVTTCAADVSEDGETTLPVRRLLDIAKTFGDTPMELEYTGKIVNLSCGNFKSKLQCIPAADFPVVPEIGTEKLSLPKVTIRDLAQRVLFALPTSTSRIMLQGALLSLPDKAVTMVATDSVRLALAAGTREGLAKHEPVLIPSATLEALLALLSEAGEGDMAFAQHDNHMFFEIDARLLVSRRMEGKFPDYQRIIPQDNNLTVSVDRVLLIAAMQRAMLINETVQLIFENEQVTATAISMDVGEAKEQVATDYVGSRLETSFKGAHVLEFLQTARSPIIKFHLKDEKSHIMLTDENYVYVVSTRRIK